MADNSTNTVVPAIHGVLHGGPNPVVGARVVMYATTSTGYGVGQSLQEATQKGTSAHQDTDSGGNFIFPGGVSCPAGQYVYVVAYGGNTGSSGANPNSVLVTALGSCSSLYSGTTYIGSNIWVSEATTVAAAYALANFITVTGNASSGYTVGIGAPATNNNGTTGCVSNAYYTTASCPATQAAGLGHAFTNAISLVSTSTGAVNSTTTNGATIPAVEINTLADAVQACVNSGGGGTTSGLPSTTTTSSGTSHDGTACGKLFAFTSYTNTGLYTGTLTAAGNTLDALLDLVKRPAGTASTFDSGCSSNGIGTTTAATCIYNLASTFQGFVPALSAAPSDWMIGLSYPKTGLSTSTTSIFTTAAGCGSNTTNNGLLYPTWVSADINDDILILNADASTPVCADIIEIGPDGTPLAATAINSTASAVVSLGLDAWGHVLLPIKGGTTTNNLGIDVYQYQPLGAASTTGDSTMALAQTITSTGGNTTAANTTSGYKAAYVQVDGNNRVYAAAQNALNDFGYYTTTQSHTAPTYAFTSLTTTTTSNLTSTSIDINNNAFTTSSTQVAGTGGTGYAKATAAGGTSGINLVLQADASGNVWNVVNNGATVGTSQTVVTKYPYTSSSGAITFGSSTTAASPTYAFPTSTNTTSLNGGLNIGAKAGVMDGNNVLWFADFGGQATTAPSYGAWLRGYDTVNNYGTPQLLGCKFFTPGSIPITAWSISGSSTTFTTTNTTPPPAGAIITLSGFTTSTFFNSTVQLTVTANGTSPSTFTVASNFGQATSSSTETGTGTGRAATACGNNAGDTTNPSNSPFLMYATRGITVDSMGNLWVANGTQGSVNEILGIAAPTLPNYIHNGTSNKP